MAANSTTFSVYTLLDFARRNALLIMGVAAFVAFWMLTYTFFVYKPGFAAKATVIIKDSAITSRYVEPEQYYALQTTTSSSSNPVLNTMGILKTAAISEALWVYFQQKHPEQLKKNRIKDQRDWQQFFGDGSSFIKAKNQPGTDLISIQFSWSNPIVAKEALDVVVKAFQDASRDLNQEEQIRRTKFLDKQVDEIEEQLAEIRRQKSEYQSKMRTVSVRREGDDLAASRMELSNRLNQLEAQARGKENLVHRYQAMLGMSPEKALRASAIGQNATINKLQDELYRLEQQYSQLNASLTETNPKVQEVKAQIEQVRQNIAAEKARTLGKDSTDSDVVADSTRNALVASMLQAQAEAQDLRTQAGVIRGRLGQIDSRIQSFPGIAEGLANIEQKEASLSNALDHLRQKMMEGRMKKEQTLSNVFIVDAPRLPDKAEFPRRVHLIVLSLVLGLGSGMAVAFGKEQFLTPREYVMPTWMEPVAEEPQPRPLPISAPQARPVAVPAAMQSPPATRPSPVQHVAVANHPGRQQPKPAARPPAPRQPVTPQPNLAQPTQKPVSIRTSQPAASAPRTNQPAAATARPNPSVQAQPKPVSAQDEALLPPPLAQRKPPASPKSGATPNQPQPYATTPQVPVMHAVAPQPAKTQPDVTLSKPDPAQQSLPFPQPRRGVPAFLLDGKAPPSQKQWLTAEDNLLADVAPVSPPLTDPGALQAARPTDPISSKHQPPRKPLLSAKWLKQKNAETHFGVRARGNQSQGLPGSLERTMMTLERDIAR